MSSKGTKITTNAVKQSICKWFPDKRERCIFNMERWKAIPYSDNAFLQDNLLSIKTIEYPNELLSDYDDILSKYDINDKIIHFDSIDREIESGFFSLRQDAGGHPILHGFYSHYSEYDGNTFRKCVGPVFQIVKDDEMHIARIVQFFGL